VAWGSLIWLLGTDEFSAPETSRFLGPVIGWLLPDLDAESRMRVVAVIRKLAHPGVYGVLAGLGYRAATRTLSHGSALRRASIALLPVPLLATADEWRQSASALRTGAVLDVGLDLAGGIAVLTLLLWIERRTGRRLFARTAQTRSEPPSF